MAEYAYDVGRSVPGLLELVIRAKMLTAFIDERRLDAVEQLIPLAQDAGLSMPHLAMAFAIAHPGVTSALLGARTVGQLDDLLAGLDTVLTDDVLTGSTRSSRPAPTSARSTRPTNPRPSPGRSYAVAPQESARPDQPQFDGLGAR